MPDRFTRSARGALSTGLVLVLMCLAFAAQAAKSDSRNGFFWHPEIAPTGPVVVVVSLDEQHIYVYRNGVAIGVGPISSGKPGYDTPTGVYTILQKDRDHHSNLYDDAPMPYMQRLTWDGVAMHGGVVPGHPASHGCVRLPQAFAEKLFAVTSRGGVVVVADSRVAPANITHPAAVAPIDLAGQPMPAPPTSATAPTPGSLAVGGAPTSVVVSLHDRMAYVLRGGLLVASSPLDVDADYSSPGTLLYVLGRPRPGDMAGMDASPTARESSHVWSAYRVLGEGPVPEPGDLAHHLRVPEAFGAWLQQELSPGSTILITSLPGYGGAQQPTYATLLESDNGKANR